MGKVSSYPAATALTGSEMILAVQGGATKRATPIQINTYILSGADDLVTAIEGLPFIIIPSQTAATIATLSEIPEGLLLNDSTNHVLVFFNGTEWRELDSTKSIHY